MKTALGNCTMGGFLLFQKGCVLNLQVQHYFMGTIIYIMYGTF